MKTIEDFLGYGPATPRVVFLGIEESAGGADPKANMDVRLREFEPTMDLLAGTRLLARVDGFADPFLERGNPVQQWNRAAEFRLALAGLPWMDADDWGRYWREHLGREAGDTFLMECFPVARASTSVRVTGYDPVAAWPARRKRLLAFAEGIAPEFVVAYGGPACERVEELFPVKPSLYAGRTAVWHAAPGTGASIALGTGGAVVARLPFFGQGQYRRDDTGLVAGAMIELRGGPSTLGHPWKSAEDAALELIDDFLRVTKKSEPPREGS